jgi:hypothetical protein
MLNPKYLVNISHVPNRANGQQLVNIGGVTQSVPTYSGEYFIASMPEIRISATGSGYVDALNNLLIIASASSDNANGPLSNTRTW